MPRALPVRSGGPLTSRTSSRSWNARPTSEPNSAQLLAPARTAHHHRSLASSRPIRQAHSKSTRRGLQAAALEVALLGDRGVEGVVALGQLAAGERGRGLRQQRHGALVAGLRRAARRRARRAGRRWRSRGRGRRSRRRSAGRGAAARRRARRRGPESPCGPARSRWRRAPRPPSPSDPAQSRTSSGRSRLPPAARVVAASAASVSPWPALCSRSSVSTSPSRPGSQRLEASRTAVTGGGTADGRRHARRAAVDRDDPAGEDRVADALQAGGVHLRGEAVRIGEAADRLRQVGVGVGVAGEGAQHAARSGRTRASRRSRAAAGTAG